MSALTPDADVAPCHRWPTSERNDRGGAARHALLVTGLLILVFAFLLAVDERFAGRLVARFCPPPARSRAERLTGRLGTSLGAWVRAQLLVRLFRVGDVDVSLVHAPPLAHRAAEGARRRFVARGEPLDPGVDVRRVDAHAALGEQFGHVGVP